MFYREIRKIFTWYPLLSRPMINVWFLFAFSLVLFHQQSLSMHWPGLQLQWPYLILVHWPIRTGWRKPSSQMLCKHNWVVGDAAICWTSKGVGLAIVGYLARWCLSHLKLRGLGLYLTYHILLFFLTLSCRWQILLAGLLNRSTNKQIE